MFYESTKADVLLIQPPILKHVKKRDIDPVQTNYWDKSDKVGSLIGDLPIEPNWGLLYLASSLRLNNITVNLVDFHLYDYVKYKKTDEFVNLAEIERTLKLKKFKMVGISALTRSADRALVIAELCKKINPDCKVILGGIHFSFVVNEVLEKCKAVDAIIKGEGEKAIVSLMNNIDNIAHWHEIEGIAFRDQKGCIHNDNKTNFIENINEIAWPDYSLWPSDVPLIPRVYLSRGCIGDCDYCVVNQLFLCKYRKRDINDVIDEIKMLKEKYSVSELLVGDLCFPADKQGTIEFCKLLIESNMGIKWWCQTKPELLDREILEYMKKAGCVQVAIGIECMDEKVLSLSNSHKYDAGNKESIYDLCKLINDYDIKVQGYFIFGLPGDTIDTSISTIKMLDRLTANGLVNVTHISVMVPYPGTSTMNNHEKYGMEIVNDDYSDFLMNCDLMNAGIPIYKTDTLDNYQIYSLWQLALSTVAKNYEKKSLQGTFMFKELDYFVDSLIVT